MVYANRKKSDIMKVKKLLVIKIDVNIHVVFCLYLIWYDLKDLILTKGATMVKVGYCHNHPLETSNTTTTLLHPTTTTTLLHQ